MALIQNETFPNGISTYTFLSRQGILLANVPFQNFYDSDNLSVKTRVYDWSNVTMTVHHGNLSIALKSPDLRLIARKIDGATTRGVAMEQLEAYLSQIQPLANAA